MADKKIYPPLMQKKSFIRSKENIISTFDWYDSTQDLGLKKYYLTSVSFDSSILITELIGTNEQQTGSISDSWIYFPLGNFEKSMVVAKGLAYLNMSCFSNMPPGTTITFKLQKYDGVTATDISTAVATTALPDSSYVMRFVILSISADVSFKAGVDSLRLAAIRSGGSGVRRIGTSATDVNKISYIYVPFRRFI